MSGELDLGKLARSWRLSIEHAQVPLGSFNWPWALGLALDEIDRLSSELIDIRANFAAMHEAHALTVKQKRAVEAERDALRGQVGEGGPYPAADGGCAAAGPGEQR